MLKRAIRSFRAQTYQNKRMLIVNSGLGPQIKETADIKERCFIGADAMTIGALRNLGNGDASEADILIHFDDDDWSHSARIAEQVALLQASGKEAVGYREMLFWRKTPGEVQFDPAFGNEGFGEVTETNDSITIETGKLIDVPGEAWLYSSRNPRMCLGTSLCYWRSVWERHPFEDKQVGEDAAWLLGVDSFGVPAFEPVVYNGPPVNARMIASIHGGNTSPAYQHLEACQAQGEAWKRVPHWDSHCRNVMGL
jgi:glycosyltransferase involved in cell wall biosynthesis